VTYVKKDILSFTFHKEQVAVDFFGGQLRALFGDGQNYDFLVVGQQNIASVFVSRDMDCKIRIPLDRGID
jgi:hypothetical protein